MWWSRTLVISAALVGFGLGAWVLAYGSESDQFGLTNEIVGGLVVGLVFLLYESRQAKKREADKLFGTTKLIVSVIFEPLNNLKRAAGEVPESYEQTATSRGAILGDNLRPLRSLVEALEKYREAVLSLKPFVENDQTLDRGSPAVLELTRHMRKLEALNLRTFKGGVLITSSAERLRLTQTVVPDVLAGAGRLINALLPDRQESDDE